MKRRNEGSESLKILVFLNVELIKPKPLVVLGSSSPYSLPFPPSLSLTHPYLSNFSPLFNLVTSLLSLPSLIYPFLPYFYNSIPFTTFSFSPPSLSSYLSIPTYFTSPLFYPYHFLSFPFLLLLILSYLASPLYSINHLPFSLPPFLPSLLCFLSYFIFLSSLPLYFFSLLLPSFLLPLCPYHNILLYHLSFFFLPFLSLSLPPLP